MFRERLFRWAEGRGYKAALSGTEVFGVVRGKLVERRAAGAFDPAFFDECLAGFRFLDGLALPEPAGVVLIAVPRPVHTVRLEYRGRTLEALIPPTYVRYRSTFTDVLAELRAGVLRPDAPAEIPRVPLKSLAAHMGLIEYGRNNIAYVPGLGSGFQLCGFVIGGVDGPLEGRDGGTPVEAMMGRCRSCRACLKICPTGAIREDRFLIAAEKCFTFLSESRRPMPEWARPPKSPCLIGCLACQEVCPEDRGRLKTEPSGIALTADETEAWLQAGRRLETPPTGAATAGPSPVLASVRGKLERLGMAEDLEVMGRNLGVFIRRRRSSRRP